MGRRDQERGNQNQLAPANGLTGKHCGLRHRHRYRRHLHRLVACDVETGAVAYTKSPTTYDRLGEAIFDCIRKAALDCAPSELRQHGTTLVINALLQRVGAKTALLATKGFRDLLEIGRAIAPGRSICVFIASRRSFRASCASR
jgi:hypothetical protein